MRNQLRLNFLIAVLFLLSIGQSNVNGQCRGTLLFSDEFDGTTLDVAKWNYDLGNGCPSLCGWGNNEKEYYTNSTQNVNVTGGYLNLTARSSPNHLSSGSDFTSGKINTKNKFDQLYGRFEAKIKMPVGTGLWPAFWLLPTDNFYGGWPTSGEIDIVEYSGNGAAPHNTMGSALHYGNSSPNNRYDATAYTLAGGDLSTDFHEYAVEWEPGEIRFYVDNNLIKTERETPNSLNPASNNAVTWPWNKRYFIILNLALGGWYTGNPSSAAITAGTVFPQSMQVDYVRVYDMVANTTQTPYSVTTAMPIPGKIEAEYYNLGCNISLAYSDTDAGNTGNVFRSDDVDLEANTDGGAGYNIGYTQTGEYTNYDVSVTSSGAYDIQLRVASATNGRTVHLEMDGVNITGSIAVPNTGGWTAYQTVTVSNINLNFGAQRLKVVFETPDVNLNYINFALINTSNLAPTVNITSPITGSNFTSPAVILIQATASDPDGTISKVEFYRGATLMGTSTTAPYNYTINGLGAGTYSIRAVAYDNELETATYTISVNVGLANGVDDSEDANVALKVFPNPFNTISTFEVSIAKPGYTSLIVYNDLGIAVAKLVDQDLDQGSYTFELSAEQLSPQVYTCVLQNNGKVITRKIIRF